MIELKNLTKKFGKNTVVDNITLTIPSGKIYGFLGPNGAGKSTTINMITNALSITSGSILINGIDVEKYPYESKKQFAYVSDTPTAYDKMSGIQFLNFIADVYEIDENKRVENIKKYSELFEMTDNLGAEISSYSHGMQQKIIIISALITDPEVFILDEPMVGLDAKSSFRLKEIMREMADNDKTVFFSTHVMEVAENICDEIAIINKGKLVVSGTFDSIKQKMGEDGSLEKIFLELTDDEK